MKKNYQAPATEVIVSTTEFFMDKSGGILEDISANENITFSEEETAKESVKEMSPTLWDE